MVSLYNSLEKFFSERKQGKGSGAGGGCGIREHGGFGGRGALEEMGEDSGDEWWCWPLTLRGTLSVGFRKVRQSVCACGCPSWWRELVAGRRGGGNWAQNPVVTTGAPAAGFLWEGTPVSEMDCSVHISDVQVAGTQASVSKKDRKSVV